MYRSFDSYDRYEIPDLILCQPTGKEIQTMSHALHIKMTLRFNCYWELEFQIPKTIIRDGVEYTVPYYDMIRKHRQVKVDNYGMFTIDAEPSISNDGMCEIKTITCKSIDFLLSNQDLVDFKGTYQLWSANPSDETLMTLFAKQFNSEWKVVEVDSALFGIYRTYEISEMNWYEFLVQKVEEDFQCVFFFDTLKKEIRIKTVKNAIKKTDIFISFENLLKKINIEENADGIKTCLSIHGADGIDVRSVNPLGTTYYYNLDYYCNESLKFLSTDTINAYKAWKEKYKREEVTYGNLTLSYNTKLRELVVLQGELAELKHQLDDLKNVLSVRIQQGLNTSDITSQITKKEADIKAKDNQIKTKENEIKSIETQKVTINNSLDFKKAFTSEQWSEVWAILRGTTGTYTNESFIKTDLMTDAEVQEKAMDLFNLGKEVLDSMAIPRYSFTSEVINILALKEFKVFANQLDLGCEVTLQIGENLYYPILLEYPIDFDNASKSTMTFCNDLRIDNDSFVLADIMNGVNNTVTSNNKYQGTWGDYVNSGDKDVVNHLLNDALDLANKKVLSTTGQAPLIDHTGIWGRKMLDNGTLSPYQTVMTSNGIYMTDSNWTKPAKLALGEITVNGITTYGLAADMMIGNLMCTKNLIVSNESNTFRIDAQGFTATNGSITLKRGDGSSEIYLNPTDGIKIRSKINNVLQDVFYADGKGGLHFKGDLTGATGSFSGEIKGSSFIGGSINIGNGNFTVNASGDCNANSIRINGGSFESGKIKGSVIEAGTIKGTDIDGARITGADIRGGNISVDTDVAIGNRLYITNGRSTGIYSDGSLMWGAKSGALSGTMFTDFDISVGGDVSCTDVVAKYITSSGEITALSDVTIGRNLYVSGNIYGGGLASENWVSRNFLTESDADRWYCANTGGQMISLQVYGGSLEVRVDGRYVGSAKLA